MNSALILIIFMLVVGLSTPCSAYVDPGTAGAIFQVTYLFLLGLLAFIGRPFRALKRKLGLDKPKKPEKESSVDEEDSEE